MDARGSKLMFQMNELEEESGEAEASDVMVDLKTSTVKSVHARWLMAAHEEMSTRTVLIKTGL
jgi:hypothetical protein